MTEKRVRNRIVMILRCSGVYDLPCSVATGETVMTYDFFESDKSVKSVQSQNFLLTSLTIRY